MKTENIRSAHADVAELNDAGVEAHIISGECRNATLSLGSDGTVECGIWEGTPGRWTSSWESWESFTVLSGAGTLTDDQGTVHELHAGLCVWVPAGATGTWEVTETVRKSYVIPA